MANSSFYVYDVIVDSNEDAFGYEVPGVAPMALQAALEGLTEGDILSLFVNSPGGSVFAASSMCSMIQRAQQKGIMIDAYIDGLAASAASFLVMACNRIYAYNNSMLMVHKPMCMCYGNADEMLKTAEELERIQTAVNMPLYMSKAKVDEEEVRALISAETWMSAGQMSDVFNITIMEGAKEVAAFAPKYFEHFQNTPERFREEPQKDEVVETVADDAPSQVEPVDFSNYESRISAI